MSMGDWSELERLAQEGERSGGAVGYAVIAPDGSSHSYNEDRRFVAASTVKVPIMVEIYRQIDRGARKLDDLSVMSVDTKTPGSGVLLHLHDGIELSVEDLIYLMISISDNSATNILIDMAGMPQINKTMRSLGMDHSSLGRKMRGRQAENPEQENWATPRDYATAMKAILEKRAATPASCDKMIAMLERQQNNRRIARYLRESEEVRWGAKPGSLSGVTNDAGFITTPTATLIVSVFCEHLPDQHTAEQLIGEISRAALQAAGMGTIALS